jgi:hypothetical protein
MAIHSNSPHGYKYISRRNQSAIEPNLADAYLRLSQDFEPLQALYEFS